MIHKIRNNKLERVKINLRKYRPTIGSHENSYLFKYADRNFGMKLFTSSYSYQLLVYQVFSNQVYIEVLINKYPNKRNIAVNAG